MLNVPSNPTRARLARKGRVNPWAWAAWLLFLLIPGSLLAKDYCVSTTSELRSALFAVGQKLSPDRILMQSGTYPLGASSINYSNSYHASVRIEGGYGPQCATRDRDPALTVIDGEGQSGFSLFFCGDMMVDALTFTGMTGDHANAFNAYSVATCDLTRSLTIDHSVFQGNGGNHALWIGPLVGQTRILNSLIVDNTSVEAGVKIQITGTSSFDLSQTTVANNTGIGLWFTVSTYYPQVSNSVIWNNAGGDIQSDAALAQSPVLRRSLYGTLNGNLGAASQNNIVSDPLFIDAANGNFHLDTGSPAINAGNPAMIDGGWNTDLDGSARWNGSRPDLGAYETSTEDRTDFTVSSTGDSGPGTLRQAILDANGIAGPARIRFNIGASCGLQDIQLISALPPITNYVEIDGFSQPGAAASIDPLSYDATVCILLRSSEAVAVAYPYGLKVSGGNTSTLIARGLAFTGFTDAILIDGGDENLIAGSRFDSLGGVVSKFGGNQIGVHIGTNAGSVRIGGASPAMRNLISGNTLAGVYSETSSTGVVLQGNLIGLTANGVLQDPNGSGVVMKTYAAIIGDNFISGNSSDGLVLLDGNNQVNSNWIGVNVNMQPLGNGLSGIHIYSNATRNVIGYDHGRGNLIANNQGAGVWVDKGSSNAIIGNRIFDNNGSGGTWTNIDLDLQGPVANDPGDADTGPNGLQNHPTITGITETASGNRYQVDYTYNGKPGPVSFQFYADPDCPGNGRGNMSIPLVGVGSYADPSGNVSGSLTMPIGVASASYFTMTANTGDDGTSEPSPCVQAPWFQKNTLLDSIVPSVGQLDPAFSADVNNYLIELPYSNDNIAFTIQANDPMAQIEISGQSLGASGTTSPIPLAVGANNFQVHITARDGVTQSTTYIAVIRDVNKAAWLDSLTASAGPLVPAFDPNVGQYSAAVPFTTTESTITAVLRDPAASLKVNGVAATSGVASAPIPLSVGNNEIKVEVTAADLSEVRTYYVYLNRADNTNARLQSLSISDGILSPAFAAHILNYSATVDNSVTQFSVTAITEETDATVSVNGSAAQTGGGSFGPIALQEGDNVIEILVTAPNGTDQATTTITVHRSPPVDVFADGFE